MGRTWFNNGNWLELTDQKNLQIMASQLICNYNHTRTLRFPHPLVFGEVFGRSWTYPTPDDFNGFKKEDLYFQLIGEIFYAIAWINDPIAFEGEWMLTLTHYRFLSQEQRDYAFDNWTGWALNPNFGPPELSWLSKMQALMSERGYGNIYWKPSFPIQLDMVHKYFNDFKDFLETITHVYVVPFSSDRAYDYDYEEEKSIFGPIETIESTPLERFTWTGDYVEIGDTILGSWECSPYHGYPCIPPGSPVPGVGEHTPDSFNYSSPLSSNQFPYRLGPEISFTQMAGWGTLFPPPGYIRTYISNLGRDKRNLKFHRFIDVTDIKSLAFDFSTFGIKLEMNFFDKNYQYSIFPHEFGTIEWYDFYSETFGPLGIEMSNWHLPYCQLDDCDCGPESFYHFLEDYCVYTFLYQKHHSFLVEMKRVIPLPDSTNIINITGEIQRFWDYAHRAQKVKDAQLQSVAPFNRKVNIYSII